VKRIFLVIFVVVIGLLIVYNIIFFGKSDFVEKSGNVGVDFSVIKSVRKGFNPSFPGRGLPDYESDKAEDIPKSYAMVLLAELIRQEKNIISEEPSLHKIAGSWLLDNAKSSSDGRAGWGVPIAWDAYGDGSENPPNTIYSISNAIVMHSLLDWLEKSPSDAPREQIHQTLDAMIEPYLATTMRTPAGLIPYSLMESDRRYDTFNPAIYFAGQLQRYSWMVEERYGKKLREIADQTMRALLLHRQKDHRGFWYWYYSVQEATPNDLPHASYIVLGIRDYIRYGGLLADDFDWPAVRDHLSSFDRGEATLFAWPDFSKDVILPARLYDLGIALHLACEDPALSTFRDRLLGSVLYYRNAEGRYQKYPLGSGLDGNKGSRVVNEYEAYLFFGLVTCAIYETK
jgi:hypothetical protein